MKKIQLKSKRGRPFYRFGIQLSPDAWTTFEVVRADSRPPAKRLGVITEAELASIRQQCELPVSKGGALEARPWQPEPEPEVEVDEPPADPKKGGGQGGKKADGKAATTPTDPKKGGGSK